MRSRTFYYDDFTDDFANINIKTKTLGDDFVYESGSILNKILSVFLYYNVAKPIMWVILKFVFHAKIKNKKLLRKCKNTGFFIYGNHSNYLPDAFIPNMLRIRRNYIVTNADSVSIPGIRGLVMSLADIPLGDSLKNQKDFINCVKHKIEKKSSVTIYPEAHIWPYYTDVRPFSMNSMNYPVSMNVPCFALSITYQKRKLGKKPKVTAFIDGPFYPDTTLSKPQAKEKLRDEIYNALKERCNTYSVYAVNEYIQNENSEIIEE